MKWRLRKKKNKKLGADVLRFDHVDKLDPGQSAGCDGDDGPEPFTPGDERVTEEDQMRSRILRELEKQGIRPVCEHHAPKPDPAFRTKPLNWFIGKHLKTRFQGMSPIGPVAEHMWTHVYEADPAAGVLRGWLLSRPFSAMVGGIDYGSAVVVRPEDVSVVSVNCRCEPEWLDPGLEDADAGEVANREPC